ncbi:hypothetical protein SARC_00606 [Sphaeroforma arctica JP610]|uniref:Uncharacterized protein n=1 Tax=Sphaeroforma arctica JP610 TaxID=667725 RepID=A0A0L0GG67_9EUKA|nr:hypothetical protein SARC_00606 [Sphaeroforma arctica JP610]KNC87278.1 hypothetical protein SARC_00606 [Sphaeroforma arctica JP610]|eukprot:XP_014161180.1 hypothetical protein SARC_00606 [Sphaeroforma arctica JP610]
MISPQTPNIHHNTDLLDYKGHFNDHIDLSEEWWLNRNGINLLNIVGDFLVTDVVPDTEQTFENTMKLLEVCYNRTSNIVVWNNVFVLLIHRELENDDRIARTIEGWKYSHVFHSGPMDPVPPKVVVPRIKKPTRKMRYGVTKKDGKPCKQRILKTGTYQHHRPRLAA